MDKLEQYLDQVCRTIGGPADMREHVRQEMREHLLDAVAQHKTAGLTETQAVDQALEEFGKVEEVRSELEATHGQRRMMALVIDRAMHWKEKTMKAKWLWMTWAYVALSLVIILEVLFITFNVLFIIPKFQKLMSDGFIEHAIAEEPGTAWMVDYLWNLQYVCGHYATFLLLGGLAAIALFEWRVKSEHKPFIRISALGTAAVGLMVVLMLMAGTMVILFCLGVPAMGRMSRPWALEQVATVDASLTALDAAAAKKDWAEMEKQSDAMSGALNRLLAGPALRSLATNDTPPLDQLRRQVRASRDHLHEIHEAITARDVERVGAEIAKLRKAFEPIREAAKRPPG